MWTLVQGYAVMERHQFLRVSAFSKSMMKYSKGQPCLSSSDCPTKSGSFAPCKCGFNSNGTKYCDIMPGDTQWVTTRLAFKGYWDATGSCHLANRWGACDQNALYYTWKCLEAKAEYYVYTLNTTSTPCVNNSNTAIPIFSDLNYYCSLTGSGSILKGFYALPLLFILFMLIH